MTNLHLIQNSIDSKEFNKNICLYASAGDSVLFLNDSLFSLLKLNSIKQEAQSNVHNLKIYAISEQLEARGIRDIPNNVVINMIDFVTFTELSQQSNKVISW